MPCIILEGSYKNVNVKSGSNYDDFMGQIVKEFQSIAVDLSNKKFVLFSPGPPANCITKNNFKDFGDDDYLKLKIFEESKTENKPKDYIILTGSSGNLDKAINELEERVNSFLPTYNLNGSHTITFLPDSFASYVVSQSMVRKYI